MLDFHKYLMRYGEHGVQALVENIEHLQGIRHEKPLPLEHRWMKVMQSDKKEETKAA